MLLKFDRLGGKCRCPRAPPPEMFDQIEVQASQGHSQSGPGAPPFISRLCASGHWQVFIQDVSVHPCIHLSLYPSGSYHHPPPAALTAQL